MESKYYKYKYDWNSLSLVVNCTKCGNNIVLQSFDGNPTCSDCGNINKLSWHHVIKEVDMPGMKRGKSNQKMMLGSITGNVILEPVESVNCYHCNSTLILPEQGDLKNHSCNSCKQLVKFTEYEDQDELVFYTCSPEKAPQQEVAQMIAVRCVSCGAPLEADPTKNNFSCKFCSTENILPLSLRYKIVLTDIFVAFRNSKYLKLMAFELDGKIVTQALRENGKESFSDPELDKVLLTGKNDTEVYNQIVHEFKYLPSDKILNELFETSSNANIINLTGTRLQRSPEEIRKRIEELSPKSTIKSEPVFVFHEEKKSKNFYKRPYFMILLIVFVFTIIMLINSYVN